MCPGGLHLKYGIDPDIAIFAKSLANGYAMSAIIGTEKHMNAAQSSFISSTNWTERIGPVAAIATIKKYMNCNVSDHIIKIGNALRSELLKSAEKNNINISISGIPTLVAFSFENEHNQKLMTYFTIEMQKRGFLGFRQFKPSYAHKLSDVIRYGDALSDVFTKYPKLILAIFLI